MGAFALSLAAASALSADVKIEEQEVGPYTQDVKFVVSRSGVHLASVVRKGSRVVVMMDNVAGPRFDEIITPAASYVDPRGPMLEAQQAGTVVGNVYQPQPVTFSKDGKRFAYIARSAEEWVVMADNKELVRLPAGSPSTDSRLQFTGDNGKHLLFGRSVYGGYELYVDGQKWPGTYSSGGGGSDGTVDPLISPDGEHIAYVAQIDREKRALILDGKDAGYLGNNLQFSADSKHLICLSQSPKGTSLFVDGKSLFNAKQINAIYVAPAGNRIATVLAHEYPDHSIGQFVLIDGKPAEATLCKQGIKAFVFSPDGKRYAAVCSDAPNVFFVVTDGKKGQVYDGLGSVFLTLPWKAFTFSADSSKLGYSARSANKEFVVINEDESDAFESGANFLFSPDGKHVVMAGMQNSRNPNAPGGFDSSWPLYLDGKAERLAQRGISLDTFAFSPDMSRHAYYLGAGQFGGGTGAIYADGKNTGLTGNFNFSPDSKHLVVVGLRGTDNKNGVFLDGQLVYAAQSLVRNRAFTPDSQHLFWIAVEPAKGPNAVPGTYEHVTYLDGKPVLRCERMDSGAIAQAIAPMGSYQYFKTLPAWDVGSDGVLTMLAPAGDVIKRYRITPSTDTSIATMLAAAASAK